MVDLLLRDRSEMLTHPITQGSFAVSNILFSTFFTLYTIYNVVSFAATTSDGVEVVFCDGVSDPVRVVKEDTVPTVLSLTPAFKRFGWLLWFFLNHIHGVGTSSSH